MSTARSPGGALRARLGGRVAVARLGEILGLDLRSLAVFRVTLACCALLDLATRWSDLVAHYTDAGIATRSEVLQEFGFLHDRALSLHMIGGSTESQLLLFSAAALAAVAMLVGYRTRAATIVLWALTASVQLRNLYVGAGYDALLRMLLLWGCFLPLGARASVDGALDPARRDAASTSRPYASVASVALIVQLMLVFFVAGYGKWLAPPWRNGSALADILADEMRVTSVGVMLRGAPNLLAALTYSVPWVEMLAPLLFLSPILFGLLRTAAVLGLAAMAAGFGIALHVGLFPLVTAAGLSVLLPGWVWDRGWRTNRAEPGEHALRAARPAVDFPRRLGAEAFCAVLLAYVTIWNLGPILAPTERMPKLLEDLGGALFLQQGWTMFAEPATRTGWLVMPGKLRDGEAIDLLAAGGRVPELAPAEHVISWDGAGLPSQQYANDRWRNFLDRAVRGTDTSRRLNLYGRYVCRTWNAAHAGAHELMSFDLWWVAADVEPGPRLGLHERKLIWSHGCFS